jgi:ATP-binding protein involved in chromosome partitioning
VDVARDGTVRVDVWLTVAGCPLRDKITRDVTAAVSKLDGVSRVQVELDVMSEEQRSTLQTKLRGGAPARVIPFAKPDSLTKVYAIASGKGGVGKSSVTVNLAAALAAAGQKVGLLDADIYGHSVPRMLGVTGRPTKVEQMIMPPEAHGVRAISAGMMKHGNEPLPMRGPILHRLLEQFLADVWWGDLDVLLMDLPPGTGDVAISAGQLIPGSEMIVVTTPQLASSEVAERAGSLANQLHQRVVGVIENMSYLPCPHCGEQVDVFGSGGGEAVAQTLTRIVGARVPVLGQVPIDMRLREAGDNGKPLVLSDPDSPAARELTKIAEGLAGKSRGLAGRPLGLSPV